jgi:lambda repressor-like predicted transcriptional regulator
MRGEWEVKERYDLEGVRRIIVHLGDMEGMSLFQMSRRAGLSHTTLWAILYRKNRKGGNTVHRSTIKKLGTGLGYQVVFSSADGTVKFTKQIDEDRIQQFEEQEPVTTVPVDMEHLRSLW